MTGSAFAHTKLDRPAGWLVDPQNTSLERWFDGSRWTDLTRQRPPSKVDSCECC